MIVSELSFVLLVIATNYGQVLATDVFDSRIIINGRDAYLGEFPYQVCIQRRGYWGDGSTHYCGGAIIDERHVLTAAHCIEEVESISMLVVVAGVTDISKPTDPHRVNLTIDEAYIHEDFIHMHYSNDIAILRVIPGFPADSPFIETIALRDEKLEVPADCTVTGWGVTQQLPQEFTDVLQALDLPLVDFDLCEALYAGHPSGPVVPGMLCAGYLAGGKDACKHDSGGPLTCGGLLTGVVSWGADCALPGYPGVYADVAHYKDWIRSTLAHSYEDAGLLPP